MNATMDKFSRNSCDCRHYPDRCQLRITARPAECPSRLTHTFLHPYNNPLQLSHPLVQLSACERNNTLPLSVLSQDRFSSPFETAASGRCSPVSSSAYQQSRWCVCRLMCVCDWGGRCPVLSICSCSNCDLLFESRSAIRWLITRTMRWCMRWKAAI